MSLKYYKNKETGEVLRSLKPLDKDKFEELLVSPNQKFMVKSNEGTNKSKIKGLEGVLKERAKNFMREHELDETIELNRANHLGLKRHLLDSSGRRKNKITDL